MLFVIKYFTKYTLCCRTHLTTLSHLLAVGGVTVPAWDQFDKWVTWLSWIEYATQTAAQRFLLYLGLRESN